MELDFGEDFKMVLRIWLVITLFIIAGASCTSPNSRYPPVEDLLLDVSVFPSDWEPSSEGPRPNPSAPFGGVRSVDRITLFFSSRNASAFEEIERYKSKRIASEVFVERKDFLFQERAGLGAYTLPDEFPFQSSIADASYFACVNPSYTDAKGCYYLACFGPYLVHFNIGWNSTFMSAAELETILQAIDEKFEPFVRK